MLCKLGYHARVDFILLHFQLFMCYVKLSSILHMSHYKIRVQVNDIYFLLCICKHLVSKGQSSNTKENQSFFE